MIFCSFMPPAIKFTPRGIGPVRRQFPIAVVLLAARIGRCVGMTRRLTCSASHSVRRRVFAGYPWYRGCSSALASANMGRFRSSTIWMRSPSVVMSSSSCFLNWRIVGLDSIAAPAGPSNPRACALSRRSSSACADLRLRGFLSASESYLPELPFCAAPDPGRRPELRWCHRRCRRRLAGQIFSGV